MKQHLAVPLVVLVLLGMTDSAPGEKLYRWVDKNGKVTYQDHPPPKEASRIEEKELGEPNVVPAATPSEDGRAERSARREPGGAPTAKRRTSEPSPADGGEPAPDVSPGVVETEDVPADVIAPGGDVAGSAKPAEASAAAPSGHAAGGAAVAPGAPLAPPPLPPVPAPVGP
jgi:hypothetical protein